MAERTALERGREVRRRLLDAAVELIAERGWTAVSTRLLAERAGVAAGLVHYHFPSLRALLAEAAVGAMREAAGMLGPLLRQAETPDGLVDLLLGSLEAYTGHDPVSVVFAETYLSATRDPQLRTAISALLAEVRGLLCARLAELGVPDPQGTGVVLAAAVDGVLLHRALDPELTAATVAPVLRRICGVPPTG